MEAAHWSQTSVPAETHKLTSVIDSATKLIQWVQTAAVTDESD